MGRNEDSLLRAAGENTLASATRGGSCAHPDQSRGLARRLNLRAISGVGASSPILLFFLGGGVALHERLVGPASRAEWADPGGDCQRTGFAQGTSEGLAGIFASDPARIFCGALCD